MIWLALVRLLVLRNVQKNTNWCATLWPCGILLQVVYQIKPVGGPVLPTIFRRSNLEKTGIQCQKCELKLPKLEILDLSILYFRRLQTAKQIWYNALMQCSESDVFCHYFLFHKNYSVFWQTSWFLFFFLNDYICGSNTNFTSFLLNLLWIRIYDMHVSEHNYQSRSCK